MAVRIPEEAPNPAAPVDRRREELPPLGCRRPRLHGDAMDCYIARCKGRPRRSGSKECSLTITTSSTSQAELSPLEPGVPHVRVAVIGSGFAGLGMAIKLREAGIEDFMLLERAEDVGGTWRDNTYPGCACDVPSHLYSFSFAPNREWSHSFSPQREIWDYLR